MPKIKVVLIEDHGLVREGIKRILSDSPRVNVIGEAQCADGVPTLLELLPDVVLLDLSLPRKDGFDLLKEIKDEVPDLAVLVLSEYPVELYAVRALKAGASGYLTKDCTPGDLINAIHAAFRGERTITPNVADLLAARLTEGAAHRSPNVVLSDREFQVFMMLGQGRPLTEIANSLLLSVKTVSTYRARALSKMSMKSNADAIEYLVRNEMRSLA